jgi:squalene-hopene/tetraprenyl-beta-curcumene cyclase
MVRARNRALELGGLERTNSFTRLYLALAGVVGWEMVPAIPPELMFLPQWAPVNIYEMSSWTRAIVIPLTILYARKPSWPVPPHARLDELASGRGREARARQGEASKDSEGHKISQTLRPSPSPSGRGQGEGHKIGQTLRPSPNPLPKGEGWKTAFLTLDRILKLYERLPRKPGRERAVRRSSEWMLQHLERSEGLAAIYPAMMNSIFALMCLGYSPDHPITARQIDEFSRFEIEEIDTLRVQPCVSPVWDTAIAAFSLLEANAAPADIGLRKATEWLLRNQILGGGDWQIKNRDAEPGGWAFEFRNDFYPDVDDTAFVLMALQGVSYPDQSRLSQAVDLGLKWMVSMQNKDGGWGAFDRDNDRTFLNNIPFADHNAMLDPSSPDVTARVVECLGRFGWTIWHSRIRRAVDYFLGEQHPQGPWYGRWGVNYVYGTSGVLRALAEIGAEKDAKAHEAMKRAVRWLRSVQQDDGGFGESIASYNDPALMGSGETTASQTAWGLLGLLTMLPADDSAVQRAAQYLLNRQNKEGSWDEEPFTGTGFPKVFYLKYHLYRHYFPLFALARYRRLK